MPFSKSSAIYSILYFFTILPTLVTSYDCTLPNVGKNGPTASSCKNSYDDDTSDSRASSKYGTCMLHQYSFSAFLQCASQPAAPNLDGPNGPIAPLDILTRVLNIQNNPSCATCKIAGLIRKAADFESLTKNICEQYGRIVPGDGESDGICCLSKCLHGIPTKERSLKNFCDKNRVDLMNAPLANCGGDDGGGYEGPDPGPDPNVDTATDEATSTLEENTTTSSLGSSEPTLSRTSTLASTSATSAASTPTATTSTGAAGRVWMTGFEVLRGVGLAVLSMLVIQ